MLIHNTLLSNDYTLRGPIKNPGDINKFLIRWPTTEVYYYCKELIKVIIK